MHRLKQVSNASGMLTYGNTLQPTEQTRMAQAEKKRKDMWQEPHIMTGKRRGACLYAVGRGEQLQVGLPIDRHDLVEELPIQAAAVEVVRQVEAVVDP